MANSNWDVIVVGAGAAGATAAIGLARAGFSVAMVEAASYPGAENWSGCVYFGENLVHPEILGPQGFGGLAWERRVVERGFFLSDGHGLLGMKYRDPDAFRHCYTVLRPVFDASLAQVALQHGAALLPETTVQSLIREEGRVIGVSTNRGPMYADLVFLAEGDAAHLLAREGYERSNDRREAPRYLQGIKQVIELPPGAIEDRFDVGPEDGVAYEIALRNGTLRGKPVHLNMGGFVYANRQSLSVGLVLPVEHLQEQFQGDPHLLMDWLLRLPALEPWLRDGRPGVFGAKLIRGGGARDIPTLIDDGLAIGGAASAIGVDFPYPNFTGPATAMGLLITQAARRIRQEGSAFTREPLRTHYLQPLQQSHYWRDVEFLRGWPGYIKKTRVFFDRNLDLALGTAHIWSRPRTWFITKWTNWLRLLLGVAEQGEWGDWRRDIAHLLRALRMRQVFSRPALSQFLLDGTINALRDLARSPRPNLPPAGQFRLEYRASGTESAISALPFGIRRWLDRMEPVLASAARQIYVNDDTPLDAKLPRVSRLLFEQVNMLDLFAAGAVALAAGVSGGVIALADRLRSLLWGRRSSAGRNSLYARYLHTVGATTNLTPATETVSATWEARLARLTYEPSAASHIQVLWPRSLPDKDAVVNAGLWHVCPAHVYEARANSMGQVQVIVNYENCIKCETCWRASDLVDWGRDGRHRFTYAVATPMAARWLAAGLATANVRARPPRLDDPWALQVQEWEARLRVDPPRPLNGHDGGELSELYTLVSKLELKLVEFETALGEEPRTIDPARAEYLESLARYAQQLAVRMRDVLREGDLLEHQHAGVVGLTQEIQRLLVAVQAKLEERTRRTWDQRFHWAAGDGVQVRQHHLVGLRRLLDVLARHLQAAGTDRDPSRTWLPGGTPPGWLPIREALDQALSFTAWRSLEQGQALPAPQDARLRDLVARIPPLAGADFPASVHPWLRKQILAELGRRDPSVAFRVASHLWARDLAHLRSVSTVLQEVAERWARGDEWACFGAVTAVQSGDGRWTGDAIFLPAGECRSYLLLLNDQLVWMPSDWPGLRWEPLATLGLRGAGLGRLSLDGVTLPTTRITIDRERIRRVWHVLSAADLVSIAAGMAERLCERAIAHANSRVQFPGLFHDEQARDTIGKFGAIKKMIAEMAAARYVVHTLDQSLSPEDFSATSVGRAELVKAVVAEALGTEPGSLTYNAGQIFGGGGYSEDDILSKYYRDAAAWRFLVPANAEIYERHGEQLLRDPTTASRLISLPNEAQLFDQVIQRQALQAELDEVRVLRSRLKSLVKDLLQVRDTLSPGASCGSRFSSRLAEAVEAVGRQDAYLLASKAILVRTHALLEHGHGAEIEHALLRVWLDRATNQLEHVEHVFQRLRESPAEADPRPLADAEAGAPVKTYAEFLQAPGAYVTGDFLLQPIDLASPRYVPELIQVDPDLAARDQGYRQLLDRQFGGRREGLIYERYVEARHRPDPADLDFCRQHGFFRTLIPKELGGEGLREADYYLLTARAQRQADVSLSLTIQVNTSIGTTPILLARNKDLPKAQQELGPFVGDPTLRQEIQDRLDRLAANAGQGSLRSLAAGSRELQARIEQTVLARAGLRNLARSFLASWNQVRPALESLDRGRLQAALERARGEWRELGPQAQELHDEIRRRREACDLFLRWIASGQISAFALTEPSAGSDTARVGTRAALRSVPVEPEPLGTYSFIPEGGREPRRLLDARQLSFRDGVFSYPVAGHSEPARLVIDDDDPETHPPSQRRFLAVGQQHIAFTDIAQLRERNGRLWYDYWELTGAKMWITNGRMAGVFCLYAKTDAGVTGFLVDGHAEGLLVGKDEAKMGQNGSPTNELFLQNVRVPRENVLGLEGRGQVNALEALNVGRIGLAVSAMTQMAGLIERTRTYLQATHEAAPEWALWRLERMEEIYFATEALACDVVGRLDHPGTRSLRMESAITKFLSSEWVHEVIELAEAVHGLPGQTQLHLVEKRKRDARVLTIYEGTNEIQRFSVLKDLIAEVAGRWQEAKATLDGYLGPEALEFEALRGQLRQLIVAAQTAFGAQLWQNPNLQPSCFVLAEAVAWLKAAESSLARTAWLEREALLSEALEPSRRITIGRQASRHCLAEVRQRLRQFEEELAHLRRGTYAPAIRAAALVLDQRLAPESTPVPIEISRPISILVIAEPMLTGSPQPAVVEGQLLEGHAVLRPADRSAIEAALRLRDGATARVRIEVAACGTAAAAHALRETLSLGVDRVRLLVADGERVWPDQAARGLASLLRSESPFDLVLFGKGSPETLDGRTGALVAQALGIRAYGEAAWLGMRKSESCAEVLLSSPGGAGTIEITLPAAIAVDESVPLRPFTTQNYMHGLTRVVELERWPRKWQPALADLHAGPTASVRQLAAKASAAQVSPAEAVDTLREVLGLTVAQRSRLTPFQGPIQKVAQPDISSADVVAVIGTDETGGLHVTAEATLHAAIQVASEAGGIPRALVLVSPDDACQRQAVQAVLHHGIGRVLLVATDRATGPAIEAGQLLEIAWPSLPSQPSFVIGEPWTEQVFAGLEQWREGESRLLSRIRALRAEAGHLELEACRAGSKISLRSTMELAATAPIWICLAADAEGRGSAAPVPPDQATVSLWNPSLERQLATRAMSQLLAAARDDLGIVRLEEAEVVIDVGYGVGNRDGYEAVIVPLEQALRRLGVRGLAIGGSRKVTEELHLLPVDQQIGQSGVSVRPRLLLAIGISGAPQHVNYLGPHTTIIAFNRDPEAPLMTLNRRQARPRVFPVVGDLFETVPAFVSALEAGQAPGGEHDQRESGPAVGQVAATMALASAGHTE